MPSLFFLAGAVLLFWGMTLGIAWPLATRLVEDQAERIVASAVLSLLAVFLLAWAVYVWSLPVASLWLLPVLAIAGLGWGRRSLAEAIRDDVGGALLASQGLVALWCVAWLALVSSYSGGMWVGDWFGHWQRAIFFLEHGPHSILFNGFDPLASRPPLANVVIGAFLSLTAKNFALYQLFSTLFSSLAFLPAALLARRLGGAQSIPLLAVLVMVSPLFVQNATFAWTKLPTVFFVLAALHFFLRAHDVNPPRAAAVLFALSLAAAGLTHYSAGPYAVLLALGWVFLGRHRWRDGTWWHETWIAVMSGSLVLTTWFACAIAVYGWRGTFFSNTTVTDRAASGAKESGVVLLNLRDTVIPHFLRSVDFGLFAQRSPWGWWRDWFFQLYQLNLLFAFGAVAWIAIGFLVVRDWKKTPVSRRFFWATFTGGVVVLGVLAVAWREPWGAAHLCLQPLILLGLALLAARWRSLSRTWRRLLLAGAIADFTLGIALQFAVESNAIDRWLTPGRPAAATFLSYSSFSVMNLRAKLQNHWAFLRDVLPQADALVVTLLAALLLLALLRARRGTAVPSGS